MVAFPAAVIPVPCLCHDSAALTPFCRQGTGECSPSFAARSHPTSYRAADGPSLLSRGKRRQLVPKMHHISSISSIRSAVHVPHLALPVSVALAFAQIPCVPQTHERDPPFPRRRLDASKGIKVKYCALYVQSLLADDCGEE